jgi:CTP-dependent riboflavin kinase
VCGRYYGLADMDAYRLFVSGDDGHLIGPAKTIHATNDAEAIGYAKARLAFFVPTPARSSVDPYSRLQHSR